MNPASTMGPATPVSLAEFTYSIKILTGCKPLAEYLLVPRIYDNTKSEYHFLFEFIRILHATAAGGSIDYYKIYDNYCKYQLPGNVLFNCLELMHNALVRDSNRWVSFETKPEQQKKDALGGVTFISDHFIGQWEILTTCNECSGFIRDYPIFLGVTKMDLSIKERTELKECNSCRVTGMCTVDKRVLLYPKLLVITDISVSVADDSVVFGNQEYTRLVSCIYSICPLNQQNINK